MLGSIVLIAIFVAMLVALLDCCLGEDDVSAYRELHQAQPHTADAPTPAAVAANKDKAE